MSEDGIDASTSRVIAEPGRYNIRDYQLRNNQIFSKGGLVDRLGSLYPDRYELNRVGKRIAESALCRDPLGVAKIALFGYARYWSQREMAKIMSTDRGEDRPIDADLIEWLGRKFGTSSDLFEQRGLGKWQGSSLTTWYQAVAGWPWALVLLHTPILLLVSVVRDRGSGRRIAVFLCLVATVIAATPCVLAPVSSPRYLHPISWMLPISLCLLCTRRSTQRGDQPSRTAAFPSRKRVHGLSG